LKELWLETQAKKDTIEPLVNQYIDVVIEGDKAKFIFAR
jgi:hypothetical protein